MVTHAYESNIFLHAYFHSALMLVSREWSCHSWVLLNLWIVDQGKSYKYSGDLTVSKRPGTSCQIKIHFSIKTTKFLVKYNLLCFQIFGRLIISFTKHDY